MDSVQYMLLGLYFSLLCKHGNFSQQFHTWVELYANNLVRFWLYF